MKLYCLCNESGDKNPSADNSKIGFNSKTLKTKFELRIPMLVREVGAEQYIRHSGTYSQHYPNVDVLRCQNCGVEIILEG